MALRKVATNPASQKVGEGKEGEVRKQLIELYSERVGGVSFSSLDAKGMIEAFTDREMLAEYLMEHGKERESNKLRKETVQILLAKADELEAVSFSTVRSLSTDAKLNENQREALSQELNALTLELSEFKVDFETRKGELEKLNKDSEEDRNLNAELENMLKEVNSVKIPRRAEVKQQLLFLQTVEKQKGDAAVRIGTDALNLRDAAVAAMITMGNIEGAFDMTLKAAEKFNEAGILGLAENFVGNVVNRVEEYANTVTDQQEKHRLLETALEACFDTAARMEKAFFLDKRFSIDIALAAEFRIKAAYLSVEIGRRADARESLLAAAKDYKEQGYAQASVPLLECVLEIDRSEALLMARRSEEDGGHVGQYL